MKWILIDKDNHTSVKSISTDANDRDIISLFLKMPIAEENTNQFIHVTTDEDEKRFLFVMRQE